MSEIDPYFLKYAKRLAISTKGREERAAQPGGYNQEGLLVEEIAEALLPRTSVKKVEPSYKSNDDDATYEVYLDRDLLGTVEARRTESWRTNSSGRIRTSMRGNPRGWTWRRKPFPDEGQLEFVSVDRHDRSAAAAREQVRHTTQSAVGLPRQTRKAAVLEMLKGYVRIQAILDAQGIPGYDL